MLNYIIGWTSLVQPIYFNDCMINCFFNQKSLYMLKRTEIQNKLGFFLLLMNYLL